MEPTSDHRRQGPQPGMIPNADPAGPVESIHNPQDDTSLASAESLETLDDELARLADDMVDGDFLSPNAHERGPDAPEVDSKVVTTPVATSSTDEVAGQVAEPVPVTAQLTSDTTAPAVPVATAVAETANPALSPPAPEARPADATVSTAIDSVVEAKPGLMAVCFGKVADALARPLEGKPVWLRQSIMIAAALQLTLAGVVWGHMLFLRSPEAPVPTISEVDLRERTPPPDAQGKSKSSGHGKGKASDHGKTKSSGHGKPKSDGKSNDKGGH